MLLICPQESVPGTRQGSPHSSLQKVIEKRSLYSSKRHVRINGSDPLADVETQLGKQLTIGAR